MKSRMRIDVVERDVRWGIRDDSSRCVVARAIARQLPNATRIEVDTQTIRFTADGKRWAFLTPLVVQNYVADFDGGRNIEPFSFWLREPVKLQRRNLTEEAKPVARKIAQAKRDAVKAAKRTPAAPAPDNTPPVSSAKVSHKGITRTLDDRDGRTPPPRVFKQKKREYGARRLRINQPQVDRDAKPDVIDPRVVSTIKVLDDLCVPNQAGFDHCTDVLLSNNSAMPREVVRVAIKIRKSRGTETAL